MEQEERVKAFTLRCEGKTWAQIGEILHYDEKTVSKELQAVLQKQPHRPAIRYPKLKEYVHRRCNGSIVVFARQMGVSPYHLRRVLVYGHQAGPKLRTKIQLATGLPWEQAFLEESRGEHCE